MEIRYQRELKHNYLVVSPDADGEQFYELHMLVENRIKGLLNMHVKYSEEGPLYYYEITSKQPLSRLLENKGMKGEEIIKLITGISAVLDSLEVFLLKEEDIWLVPDQIYIEPEDSQVFLCLIPGLKNDFPDAMRELLQFLLGKVDHRDKEGVVLAYGLFQESQKENYGIKDLNNMGAAMAPAALDTMLAVFDDTHTSAEDYDGIFTGDLGRLGGEILRDLCRERGVELGQRYSDCGEMIFSGDQKCYSGGSGAGCSACVLNSFILEKMRRREYDRVLLLATGALMSPTTSCQGESIPAVSHAVILENDI